MKIFEGFKPNKAGYYRANIQIRQKNLIKTVIAALKIVDGKIYAITVFGCYFISEGQIMQVFNHFTKQ